MRFLLVVLTLFSFSVFAQEFRYLNRSPKGLLSGDAYTGVVDDEYALFYNPAAMGRNRGFSFTPVQGDLSVTNVLADKDRFDNFPKKDPVGIANRVIGFPIHAHAATTPGFKMGGLGFSLLANQTANVIVRNRVHPTVDIDYRYDRGFVLGYAHSFGSAASGKWVKKKSYKNKKKEPSSGKSGSMTSFGVSFKSINRDSLTGSFPLFGTELINIVSAQDKFDYTSIRDGLGYSKGQGWGYDLGIEETIYKGNAEINTGFSVMDVGDTKFHLTQGTGSIPKQKMMLMYGLSYKQDFGWFDYRFSFDLHPLNVPTDYGRKVHAGFEAGPKIIKLMAGYNAGYFSYGAMVDLFIFRVMAGFYGIETGTKFHEEQSKRAIIYLSLLDFSFDV